MPFSSGYCDIAALSPWELNILCPFRLAAISKLLCLRTLEGVNLGQAGFGDFLADSCVGRLKGRCDDNKEVYWLIQFDKWRTQID